MASKGESVYTVTFQLTSNSLGNENSASNDVYCLCWVHPIGPGVAIYVNRNPRLSNP